MLKFFDGAFGTYYYDLTNDNSPCEYANISNPDTVLSIHREYIKAGVNAIKTNTFNANLSVCKDYHEIRSVIKAGYNLAVQAAENTNVSIFADIGYINEDDPSAASDQYAKIADIFIESGAVNFLFETLCEYEVITPALRLIKEKVPRSTVLTSFAVSQDGYTRRGLYYKDLLNSAEANNDIDIAGLNCICGPAHLLNLVKDMKKISKPLSIMPNSGYPSSVNGRTVFQNNAEYFASKINELHMAGINIFGGCCGTTPEHIRLAIECVNSSKKVINKINRDYSYPMGKNTKKLALKPLAVELDPPHDSDCGFILNAAAKLKTSGVSMITFADSPLAKARADSVMTAAKVKRETGIDVLPHITCRDKNHISIKGTLLGASFEGIDKILAITGDPVASDTYFRKSGVFNFNSIELIAYINSLNAEIFAHNPISAGGAINVNTLNFENELTRCNKKIENGAEFLFSQPIFTKTAADNFIKASKQLNCKMYAGILPVASYKNAVFLNNEVAGIEIPQDIISQLKDKPIEEVYDISINFCRGIINSVYTHADGFYIMTPLKKVDLICSLIMECFDV